MLNILGIPIAILLLTLSEKYNVNVKSDYNAIAKRDKKREWDFVLKTSIAGGVIAGLISFATVMISGTDANWALVLPIVSTVLGYISVQAFQTDTYELLSVDRHVLRIGYTISFLCVLYLYFTKPMQPNGMLTIMAYISGFILLLAPIKDFGPSDARAILITFPFTAMLVGEDGLVFFLIICVIIIVVKRLEDLRAGMIIHLPIVIYFLIPYLLLFIAYPLI